MASVTYDHVTKQFKGRGKEGAVAAVNDLSIEVKDQEFLVLVGPSGCGKTTALRLLAGLEEITAGNIYIGERLVNDVAPKDRDIAMVFQSYALYPHMSVYDNMAFGLKLRKTPKSEIERRVKEAADILNIGVLLQRKPKELSGGQRQRVALGRAIVREPQVFLMDEPLSNLDAKLRVATRAELIKLHRRLGTTFIYVTHDQVEAMTMGTRIAVMNHGVLQQIDTPQNLYNNPANIFVAGFIGSPAMNFLDVTLVRQDSKLLVDGGSFRLEVPESRKNELMPHAGKPVRFGIRPEDIHDRAFEPVGVTTAPLNAKVDVTELMGNEIIVSMLVGGKSVTARMDPRTQASPGQDLSVSLNLDNMHLFDLQTELSLLN